MLLLELSLTDLVFADIYGLDQESKEPKAIMGLSLGVNSGKALTDTETWASMGGLNCIQDPQMYNESHSQGSFK